MIDTSKLNRMIFQDIASSIIDGYDCGNHLHYEEARRQISSMSIEEAFDHYLKYNGIIGYTYTILAVVKNLTESGSTSCLSSQIRIRP
jgi:hypothetical protein